MLPWGTPISSSSESFVAIHSWNFRSVKFYKNWQSTRQSHIFQVFDHAIFPRSVIGLFYIQKYMAIMFSLGESFSYEGFQVD